MFEILFNDNFDLCRVLINYSIEGYFLKKDFIFSGFYEIFFYYSGFYYKQFQLD
jgi:NADH:ubiquinone oxidoreductase subunit C